jgi:hypothetical protein
MKNQIKVFTVLGIAVLISSSVAFSFTATITDIGGTVKHVKNGTSEWQLASVGTALSTGDKVGSKESSWAEISFSAGHKAKLGPNSFMVINQMDENTSLELFKGDLLSKVKKLSSAQTYEVKTPQSVASVKGTQFIVIINEESQQTQVMVYEGSVMAKELITGMEVEVPAGKYTQIKVNIAPSEPEDLSSLESGDVTLTASEEPEDEAEEAEEEEEEQESEYEVKLGIKEEIRQEIREAVVDIKIDVATAQDIIETTKENDTQTGRTLKDVHGNLVRVEQYICRPSPETIQFINITKRSDYRYNGRMNVSPTGARLDSIEQKVTFNKEIPEKISNWFDYFSDVADVDDPNYFYPELVEVKISNQDDSITMSTEWDEDLEDMADPIVKLNSAKEGAWLVDIDAESGSDAFWDSEDKLEAWMITPEMRIYRDTLSGGTLNAYDAGDESRMVRFGQEFWLINDEGSILDANTFSEGFSGNPFELIKNMAFENSLVCRYDIPTGTKLDLEDVDEDTLTNVDYGDMLAAYNDGTDLFSRNIDIVVTPDLFLNIAETIAKNVDISKIDFDSDDDMDNTGINAQ